MRIASVNASVRGGGAERVARSLHEAYRALGHDAWLLVGNENAGEPGVIAIPNERYRAPWARRVRRFAARAASRSVRDADAWWCADRALRALAEPGRYARVSRGHEDFEHPATQHLLELPPSRPDVLHLHNLHGSYFDIRALPALTAAVPAVLTLHDTWWLTGHCAQPFACERWLEGCDVCPHLDRYVPLMADASAANAALKRDVLARSRIALVAPSRWLLDMAERVGATRDALDARVITNGIDTRVFSPGDRTAAREALGLASDERVVLTVGRDVATNPFKGFDLLEAALRSLAERGERALVVAIGSAGADRALGGVRLRFVPFIDSPTSLATWYQAADVYAHPARAEALGLTLLEAAACGVPAVASRVGGIPEVVQHDVTGLLVEPDRVDELAGALGRLLADDVLRVRLGQNAARHAAQRHSIEAQAEAYLGLMGEIARLEGGAVDA